MTNHDKPTLTYIHIYTLIRHSNIEQERVPQALVLLLENPSGWETNLGYTGYTRCHSLTFICQLQDSCQTWSRGFGLPKNNHQSQMPFLEKTLDDFPSYKHSWLCYCVRGFSMFWYRMVNGGFSAIFHLYATMQQTADCIQAPFPASMRFTHGAFCAMTLAPRRVMSGPRMSQGNRRWSHEPWLCCLGARRDNEKAACPCSLKSSVCLVAD